LYVSGAKDLQAMQDLVRLHDVLEPVAFGTVYAVAAPPAPMPTSEDGVQWLGGIEVIPEALRVHQFNEIIMSGREVSAGQMIRAMSMVSRKDVRFRIAWTDEGQIVGAGGPERRGITDWHGAIFKPRARRAKRAVDVGVSLAVLLLFPVFIARKQGAWLGAAVDVLLGTCTWVGYLDSQASNAMGAPSFIFQRAEGLSDRAAQRTLLTYVRDYRWTMDAQVIWEALISYRAIHRHGSN
jgi:hypothetical protein